MTTQAAPLTHCPNCKALLKRPDLSICAYCAMPLALGVKTERASDEVLQRLARMRENPQFPAAAALKPWDPEVEFKAQRMTNWGWFLFAIGLCVGGLHVALAGFSATRIGSWIEIGVLFIGLCLVWYASVIRKRENSRPCLCRPAIVVERGSKLSEFGRSVQTYYFFLLRFDDGSEGEFRWLGQGTSIEPFSNGQVGIAYTRGERLISFRKL